MRDRVCFAMSGVAKRGVDRRNVFAAGGVAVPCVQTRPKWAKVSGASLGRRVFCGSFSGDYVRVAAIAGSLVRVWP